MTALTRSRQGQHKTIGSYTLPLAVGNKAWKGGACGADISTGKVEPMHAEGDLLYIGIFEEDVDATSAEKPVSVDVAFGSERLCRWWANDGTITIDDRFSIAYFVDDQTVGIGGAAEAGRIWDVDALKGVLIETLQSPPGGGGGGGSASIALPDFESNAITVDDFAHGAWYDVPDTGAASAIILPAAAPDGTQLNFSADGTSNGHTVTYRDETGDVALTTALTALKRHIVIAKKLAGTWRANAYVSP